MWFTPPARPPVNLIILQNKLMRSPNHLTTSLNRSQHTTHLLQLSQLTTRQHQPSLLTTLPPSLHISPNPSQATMPLSPVQAMDLLLLNPHITDLRLSTSRLNHLMDPHLSPIDLLYIKDLTDLGLHLLNPAMDLPRNQPTKRSQSLAMRSPTHLLNRATLLLLLKLILLLLNHLNHHTVLHLYSPTRLRSRNRFIFLPHQHQLQ